MTSDITVNLSGSWSAKQRQDNGLGLVAAYVNRQYQSARQVPRIPVVAYVQYHEWKQPLSGPQLVVSVPVIEPCFEADGSDPDGIGQQIMDLLDELRRRRGKGSVADVPSRAGEIEGQGQFDFSDPDGGEGGNADEEPVDTNASGDPVPPASGAEIVAELDERRAAKKAVPAAEFAGGAE